MRYLRRVFCTTLPGHLFTKHHTEQGSVLWGNIYYTEGLVHTCSSNFLQDQMGPTSQRTEIDLNQLSLGDTTILSNIAILIWK